MTVRVIEGEVTNLGSISGTDGTPFGIWEPTRAARVFLENPVFVPNFEQTVINTTASGSGVVIQGGGIVNVSTAGQVITVSGPAFEEIEGDDVDSLNTLTGTVTIASQNNASVITNVPSNTIFIDVPFDEDDVDSINTVTGTVILDGSDGNTVLPAVGQTITIQGFRPEFVAASGSLQDQIDNASAGVLSLNSLDGVLDIAAGNNITVTDNGSDTITINSFTDDDVDSITVSGTTVTGSVTLESIGSVGLSVSGQTITVSGSSSSVTGGAGVISGIWKFNNSTSSSNPGKGKFRLDSATYGLVTELIIADETDDGFDASNIISVLESGDRIYIQEIKNASNFVILDVTSIPIDNSNWFSVSAQSAEAGDIFSNNKECMVGFIYGGTPTSPVSSLNTLTGDLTLSAGNNITISDNGSDTITINSFTDDDVDSINTVTGTVTLTGNGTNTVSTSGQTITVSGAGVTSFGFEDDGITYIDDPTRGNKRLSTHRQHFGFGRNGTADNTYLRVGNTLNNNSGWIMPRDAVITSWSTFYPSGAAGTKGFEIRVNNVAVALVSDTVTQSVVSLNPNLNIDINEGDRLQVFAVSAGGAATDTNSSIEIAWRK